MDWRSDDRKQLFAYQSFIIGLIPSPLTPLAVNARRRAATNTHMIHMAPDVYYRAQTHRATHKPL
jgi:hypothetical protein